MSGLPAALGCAVHVPEMSQDVWMDGYLNLVRELTLVVGNRSRVNFILRPPQTDELLTALTDRHRRGGDGKIIGASSVCRPRSRTADRCGGAAQRKNATDPSNVIVPVPGSRCCRARCSPLFTAWSPRGLGRRRWQAAILRSPPREADGRWGRRQGRGLPARTPHARCSDMLTSGAARAPVGSRRRGAPGGAAGPRVARPGADAQRRWAELGGEWRNSGVPRAGPGPLQPQGGGSRGRDPPSPVLAERHRVSGHMAAGCRERAAGSGAALGAAGGTEERHRAAPRGGQAAAAWPFPPKSATFPET